MTLCPTLLHEKQKCFSFILRYGCKRRLVFLAAVLKFYSRFLYSFRYHLWCFFLSAVLIKFVTWWWLMKLLTHAFQFYSKPIAAIPPTFKSPFTATYPANGLSFPKLSYANSYNGYPTASYATTSHHNAIAYPSIQYPSYHHNSATLGGSYSYHHQPIVQSPVQTSVQHHGIFASAPASPLIYGNGIHKVRKKIGMMEKT